MDHVSLRYEHDEGELIKGECGMRKKNFKVLSLACLLICILVWIPNIVFQVASPLFLVTFVIAPVGIVFAAMIRNYWLIFANTVMFFSFFLFMFVAHLTNSH